MQIAILQHDTGYPAYLAEMLNAWGLRWHAPVSDAADLDPAETPVLLVPAGAPGDAAAAYAARGGTVIAFQPTGVLVEAAGWRAVTAKGTPLRLRLTGHAAAGVAGEALPVVGSASSLETTADIWAYLCHPGRYEGQTPGVTRAAVGRGQIIAFAFDLPQCVWRLRQGEPERAEQWPSPDTCPRSIHLAADLGGTDTGWVPFADLLARYLVDIIRRALSMPAPLLAHLPGDAPGLVLFSGDEDNAAVALNLREMDAVASFGGRMSLYLIPEGTPTTPDDVREYRRRGHEVGPHPNLRPLDGAPMAARIADYSRQLHLYQERYGPADTLRNHSLAWAGYLELVEEQQAAGIGMDANFISTVLWHSRDNAPYLPFGGALPLRFCHPDGRLLDVFQQHTHCEDDAHFALDNGCDYPLMYSEDAFAAIFARVLDDVVMRLHTPYAVVLHPGNWGWFSEPYGRTLLALATERGLPVWSFDQWHAFWRARDGWRFTDLTWDGTTLAFTAAGAMPDSRLRLQLPRDAFGCTLEAVTLDGCPVVVTPATRYREAVVLITLPPDTTTCTVRANYY